MPLFRVFAVAVALTYWGSRPAAFADESLSAREVLEKSQKAMSRPLRYTMTVGSVESIIYSDSTQPDRPRVRTELVTPVFDRITVTDGKEHYEWYPKSKLGIDTAAIHVAVAKQAGGLGRPMPVDIEGATPSLLPEVSKGEKTYYVVEEKFPESVLGNVAGLFPGVPLPVAKQSVIDRQTFLLDEVRTLFRGDTPPQVVRYSNYMPLSDPANELFLPPDGYKWERVGSLKDYLELIATKVIQPLAGNAKQAPVIKPQLLARVKNDPNTGRAIAPVPSGMTRKQFDEIVKNSPDVGPSAIEPIPEPVRGRLTNYIIAFGLLVVIGGAIFGVYRARKTKAL